VRGRRRTVGARLLLRKKARRINHEETNSRRFSLIFLRRLRFFVVDFQSKKKIRLKVIGARPGEKKSGG